MCSSFYPSQIGLKEEQQRVTADPPASTGGSGDPPLTGSGGSSGGKTTMAGQPSMKDSLHALMKRLAEKRREGNRPEDLSVSMQEAGEWTC